MSAPTITYAGPRSFPADAAGLSRECERLANEVDRLIRLLVNGKASRFELLDQAAADTVVGIDQCRPVIGTLLVRLPALEPALIGRWLAVQRLSASGAVTVRPTSTPTAPSTINGAASAVLAAAIGVYRFLATPTGWAS